MPKVFADITPLRESSDFRRLWFGQLISFSGTQLTAVAVPLQVFLLTHSSFKVGLVSLAQLGPLVVGSFAGGAMADRHDRRTLILWSNVAMAATSVGLAFNAGPHSRLWPIVLLSATSAGFSGIWGPARGAIVPTLVRKELWTEAAALWQIVMQVAFVVGPAIAGLLIGAFSLRVVYIVDAATFAAAIIGAIRMAPAPAPPHEGEPISLLRSATDGWRYLRTSQAVKGTFAADLVAMIFGMPRALFPAIGLVQLGGGPRTVGLLYSAVGAGGLIGAATTGSVGRVRRQGRAVVIAIAIWGIAIAGFGLAHSLPLALVCLAVAGAADVWSAVFRNTIMQLAVDERYRGRLSAIHILVVTGGPRLGDLESGSMAAAIGAPASVVTGGLACVIGIIAVARLMPAFARALAPSSVDAE